MKMLRVLFVAVPFLLSGCATYNLIKPPPVQTRPIAVQVIGEGPSGWNDLPLGAYRVPNTNVIITGHQQNNFGMLFGLLGVAVQDAVQTSNGKQAVKPVEATLHIDLGADATDLTAKAVASGKYGQTFTAMAAPDGPVLTVNPYTVISFVNDTQVRPYVVIRANIANGPKGSSIWSSRYIASVGPPIALQGEGSLTADNGVRLKAALDHDLPAAVNAMLDDVARHPPRDDAHMTYVETAYPFLRPRIGMTGYALAEDGTSIVFAPKFADAMVLAGVHVLDKSITTARPAAKDDGLKMLDEGK